MLLENLQLKGIDVSIRLLLLELVELVLSHQDGLAIAISLCQVAEDTLALFRVHLASKAFQTSSEVLETDTLPLLEV